MLVKQLRLTLIRQPVAHAHTPKILEGKVLYLQKVSMDAHMSVYSR